MSDTKTTKLEKVLPSDEDLGRRNCCWRELAQKYEKDHAEELENAMDIDAVIEMINDQEMDPESSVSDVEEASSQNESGDENQEDIKQQLKLTVSSRKRTWEVNGLKEILEDRDFAMVSHEKVENWLRNQMHSISSQLSVQYKKKVTTVTETCMDADADSQYSVDTAQYIRSNKKVSNRVKVTTMIKQYAVTSNVRYHSMEDISDTKLANDQHTLQTPSRRYSITEMALNPTSSIDNRRSPQTKPVVRTAQTTNHRTRKKVFKKTIPRKRVDRTKSTEQRCPQDQQPMQAEMYEKALEQCAKMKKNKTRRSSRVSKNSDRKLISETPRKYSSTSSSDDNNDEEVFRGSNQYAKSSQQMKTNFSSAAEVASKLTRSRDRQPTLNQSNQSSSSEQEIVEPFQSITLGVSKRQRLQNEASSAGTDVGQHSRNVCMQSKGKRHGEGLVIFRPKVIHPTLPDTEQIYLRMADLTLEGVTKQRDLELFRDFNYKVHPNSIICFYPSDSECDESRSQHISESSIDSSLDADDPILTFNPRNVKRLNLVEKTL
ncbi:uncharacterized protein LOC128270314 [Anopheles cruzii]|uniref:uncharacterized protein LOC128270314 n=1 Tax=Anopheles cruzii TaxID=68878 RepID=UPI0022EC7AAB|nr:uncharacterized protein LOC128270314 [Anopheles cruzii]